jgi:phenylpropionate dioxygenase-like ring-hydroxylating dioxygenase large terminal subunit
MTQRSVPAERYTSPDWLAQELDRVFGRAWLLAAHCSELESQSFSVFEIAGESILLTRDADGALRAFYNVCQHRGALLCAEERGRTRSFRCPYHHWEYALDGRLSNAPGAGAAAADADGEPIRLSPVHVAERFGFIWVCLSATPPRIDDYLAPVAHFLAAYRPEQYRLKNESVVEVEANWKASADVNNEGYHVPMLHPSLLEVADVRTAAYELCGDHSAQSLVLGQPSRDVEPDAPVSGPLRELLQAFGAADFPGDGRMRDVRPAIARAFRQRLTELGTGLPDVSDERLTVKQQVHVFPNVQLNFLPLSLEMYRHRPHPTDPGRCWFDELGFVRAGDGPAPEAQRLRFRHGERKLGPVMDADVNLLPRLQAGMRSRGLSSLRITDGELCIAHMHGVLERWLEGEEAS